MPTDDRRPLRAALDPISTPYFSQLSSAASGTMSMAKEVIMGGFGGSDYRRSESMRILSDRELPPTRYGFRIANAIVVTPSLMNPRILAQTNPSSRGIGRSTPVPPSQLLRLPTTLPSTFSQLSGQRQTSTSLAIIESVDRLAQLSLTPPPMEVEQPSLIKGFKATIPSSELAKQRRRLIRGGMVEEELGGKLGLKKLGDRARGLLTDGMEEERDEIIEMGRKSSRRRAREKRRSQAGSSHFKSKLHLEDLVKQADEIAQDKENLHTRTVSRDRLLDV